ncbi:hypothetical protein TNCT_243851 [Trichonephila clavata]|uniref:Uncharacterized protein n=1 Tax=Trichonephila clavata TaxID=2740835 RepID=A0A8X6GYC6_TRICU|nr:hypothetical protein TNCT_243851 [Trichonephila clavata]
MKNERKWILFSKVSAIGINTLRPTSFDWNNVTGGRQKRSHIGQRHHESSKLKYLGSGIGIISCSQFKRIRLGRQKLIPQLLDLGGYQVRQGSNSIMQECGI